MISLTTSLEVLQILIFIPEELNIMYKVEILLPPLLTTFLSVSLNCAQLNGSFAWVFACEGKGKRAFLPALVGLLA